MKVVDRQKKLIKILELGDFDTKKKTQKIPSDCHDQKKDTEFRNWKSSQQRETGKTFMYRKLTPTKHWAGISCQCCRRAVASQDGGPIKRA